MEGTPSPIADEKTNRRKLAEARWPKMSILAIVGKGREGIKKKL